MKNNFLGLKGFVESKYPQFQGRVSGEVYPPSNFAVVFSKIAGYAWFIGVALLLTGSTIFDTLGIPMPEPIVQMNKNKPVAFFVLFVINSLGNSLMATGAFEIYINDELIFSKLQSGHFPNADELIAAMNTMGFKAS
mmetsp:Transcript_31075/g.52495  ORF Transcript_31075/g.52495 Transcript_31075/m.52495 type:complete len:137 (+) Transcript_31075:230-640(+)